MALLYFHYDKNKMVKKSSQIYFSHMRLMKTALIFSIILNVLIIILSAKGAI